MYKYKKKKKNTGIFNKLVEKRSTRFHVVIYFRAFSKKLRNSLALTIGR